MNGFAHFRGLLTSWLEKTSLFPNHDLHIDLILNPFSGGLRHPARRQKLIEGLLRAPSRVPAPPLWSDRKVHLDTWVTDYAGHEEVILAPLHAADLGPNERRLIVCAGGDGTSRGALISALGLPLVQREKLLFLRLPLGTGNDAAEIRDWDEALEILSGRGAPSAPQPLPVLEVSIPGRQMHYSFNIASFGLDAFVADLTNRLKSWLPGNSYSLMVDVAALFYEAFVRVVPSTLELSDHGRTVLQWNAPFLLAAMGAQGFSSYGGGKHILPDQDNLCIAGRKNLWTKLSYRKPVYKGTHRGLDGITLASGNLLTIRSPVRIPLQMDGEVLWLEPEEFPVTFEIVDRGLQVLKPSSKL